MKLKNDYKSLKSNFTPKMGKTIFLAIFDKNFFSSLRKLRSSKKFLSNCQKKWFFSFLR